jgi:hypothetical protein
MLTNKYVGVLHTDECSVPISFLNRSMFNQKTSESHYTLHRQTTVRLYKIHTTETQHIFCHSKKPVW